LKTNFVLFIALLVSLTTAFILRDSMNENISSYDNQLLDLKVGLQDEYEYLEYLNEQIRITSENYESLLWRVYQAESQFNNRKSYQVRDIDSALNNLLDRASISNSSYQKLEYLNKAIIRTEFLYGEGRSYIDPDIPRYLNQRILDIIKGTTLNASNIDVDSLTLEIQEVSHELQRLKDLKETTKQRISDLNARVTYNSVLADDSKSIKQNFPYYISMIVSIVTAICVVLNTTVVLRKSDLERRKIRADLKEHELRNREKVAELEIKERDLAEEKYRDQFKPKALREILKEKKDINEKTDDSKKSN